MLYQIDWAGKNVRNHGSRMGMKPSKIVNHISAGSMTSMLNTFENPVNKASSHYAISREGNIVQYVKLDRASWCQGIVPERYKDAKVPFVREIGRNPNLYCVSIEHEGYVVREDPKDPKSPIKEYYGLHGDITEEQFRATCWLNRFIKDALKTNFGIDIALTPANVVGHFQIDQIRKPVCPGPKFPWARLYAELAAADSMTLEQYEERLSYLAGDNAKTAHIVALAFRIDELVGKLGGKHDAAARWKLDQFTAILASRGFAIEGVETPGRIKGMYETWRQQGKDSAEAYRKLDLVAVDAKNANLL